MDTDTNWVHLRFFYQLIMNQKKGRPTRSRPLHNQRVLTRRDMLKGAVGLGAVAALSSCVHVETDSGGVTRKSVLGKNDSIRRENEKPGTRDWLLTNTRVDPKTKYRCPWIEGYCSHTSLRAGDTLAIMVSTNPPSPFVLDVYR